MNNFELKLKLKKTYPDLKDNIINEIVVSTKIVNTDVQTFIDRSVAFVKDSFTVQTIDVYAKKIATFTHDFLNKLDKLGISWLISSSPTGINYYSDELKNVLVESFEVQSASPGKHIARIRSYKNKSFIMNYITEEKSEKIMADFSICGAIVNKTILAELL